MPRKVVHVTPRSEGTWVVKSQGAQKASNVFQNKSDAIQRAREIAKNSQTGQVKVHKQDGGLQTEYTYGRDPKRYTG